MNQEDINEDDEKLFESFFVKNAPPQRTLADIIIKKIKDNDSQLAEGLMMIAYLFIVLCWIIIVADCKAPVFFFCRRASRSSNGPYDS